MVQFIRIAVLLLLLSAAVLFVMSIATGQARYKLWGLRIFKWTVFAALGLFAGVIAERAFGL